MKRIFIKTLIASVALAAAGVSMAQDKTIKFATQNPKGHPIVVGMEKFKEVVESKSGGKIKVQIGIADHAERRRVHDQISLRQEAWQITPCARSNTRIADKATHFRRPGRIARHNIDPAAGMADQRCDDSPTRPARAENKNRPDFTQPTVWNALDQSFPEPFAICRFASDMTGLINIDRIDASDPPVHRVADMDKCGGRFLVGNGDVASNDSRRRDGGNEATEILRRDRHRVIRAIDPERLEPVSVNQRRARVADRPADDASAPHGRSPA